jgi:hypothetical protein
MTPGAVKLRESLQQSWRVYLVTEGVASKISRSGTNARLKHTTPLELPGTRRLRRFTSRNADGAEFFQRLTNSHAEAT